MGCSRAVPWNHCRNLFQIVCKSIFQEKKTLNLIFEFRNKRLHQIFWIYDCFAKFDWISKKSYLILDIGIVETLTVFRSALSFWWCVILLKNYSKSVPFNFKMVFKWKYLLFWVMHIYTLLVKWSTTKIFDEVAI